MARRDTHRLMALGVSDRLRMLRKVSGLSRKVIASRLGVTEAAVQHHESGKNEPTLGNLAKYSRIYRISTDWIVLGKGKGPTDARNPDEALLELWHSIPAARRPQALLILQSFLSQEKDSA